MRKGLFALLLISIGCTSAMAAEVDGIAFPSQVEVAGNALVLNGAGIRTKYFLDIYAMALYTVRALHHANAVLANTGAKRIVMHFIFNGVSQKRFAEGWNDGFEDNQTAAEMKVLRPRLAHFISLFTEAHRDDVYRLDLLPSGDTEVFFNGRLLGKIGGMDFQRALLAVWLGDHPADSDLKPELLGRS